MTFARRAVWLVGVVLLTAPALAQSPDPAQVLANLRANHPGVRILEHTGLVRTVCAQPMTSAATPRQAAADWLRQYVGVFGAGSPELLLESSRRISGGKHVLTYEQHVADLPVEDSRVKLVIHEQRVCHVVYVCAKVAAVGPGVLDLFDYMAFQRLFAQRDPAACDCDTTTGPSVCDLFDFLCFQNAFVAGCP